MLKNTATGFTLIELLTCIAVMAISMAFAAPAFQSWMTRSKIRSTAQQVASALQLAKSESLRRNALVTFSVAPGNNWQISCVATNADCPALIQQQKVEEAKTSGLSLQYSEGNNVTFNALGQLANSLSSAAPLFITVKSPDNRVNRQIRIQISQAGNVRLCTEETVPSSPNLTPC